MVYSNSETECRDRTGVEIAVPQPQPLERGRHVPSPQGECQEGDPPAQQRRGGYENEAAAAGDQEPAREASQRDRAEELGQWISRQWRQQAYGRVGDGRKNHDHGRPKGGAPERRDAPAYRGSLRQSRQLREL